MKTNEYLTSYINNETKLSDHESKEIEPESVQKSPTERPIRQICCPKRLIKQCLTATAFFFSIDLNFRSQKTQRHNNLILNFNCIVNDLIFIKEGRCYIK